MSEEQVGTTPEFLAWTLAHDCSLKSWVDDIRDPLLVERHLRGIRAYSQAQAEDRCVGELCFAKSPTQAGTDADVELAFLSPEVLALFGGDECVRQSCGSCTANSSQHPGLAGCYGWFQIEDRRWYNVVEPVLDDLRVDERTRPSWYAAWIGSERGLAPQLANEIARRLTQLNREQLQQAVRFSELQRLIEALEKAGREQHPFFARLFPAGELYNEDWWLPVHCPRCKFILEREQSHSCPCCSHRVRPEPRRRRKRRGQRPFAALSTILPADRSQEALNEYRSRGTKL